MSAENDALAQLKIILADIDPSPEPTPAKIWVYPQDHEFINFDEFPVIIVSQMINRRIPWQRQTFQLGRHQWPCEIDVFLCHAPLLNDAEMAEAEVKLTPWPVAMGAILNLNQKLNNTCQSIGEPSGNLFYYQAGHIMWGTKEMFGLRFELPIVQSPIQIQGN